MAVNFPSSPTNGDTVTVGGIAYVYDSTQGVWSDSPQGLTQSIDKLTDVDTSTTAPANRQVLQWNSTDEKWKPADSGVQVYATIDDLPLSGVTEGSMALVDSTDKLYIFSDSGWYSIAIVNQTPSISGVNATYTLATDGTATTVTVTATDPEGLPITYSIVSDTSGNIATVTQGTGANTNQWTITPSTNTANAGNFTLVFRASDGVNIASTSSTFRLTFQIENSNYTTALITSVGANNDTNNTYTDSSSSSQTVTKIADNKRSTFSPYRPGGYSTYFDGTGDYLSIGTSSTNETLSGDFCIEAWIYPTGTNDGTIIGNYLSSPNRGWSFRSFTSNNLYLYFQIDGGSQIVYQTPTNSVNPKEWNHVVWCRSGTDTSVFINGSRSDNRTLSGTATGAGGVAISALSQGFTSYNFTGYITDARIVNGSSVYDPSQTTLTVPTERLTAITNTSLLTCHLPYIADGSTNDHSITVNGNTSTQPFGPYDYLPDITDAGGSVTFDQGVVNPINIADDATMEPGSEDFQVEFWSYRTGTAPTGWSHYYATGGTGGQHFIITGVTTNVIHIGNGNGSSWSFLQSTGYTHPQNIWTHMAVTRVSNTWKFYANGKLQWTDATNSAAVVDYSGPKRIGGGWSTSQAMGQMISDFRYIKGSVTYTSNFTPPTAPLSATTDTKLLLNFNEGDIVDRSQSVKTVTLTGDVKSSTTQTKYLTSSIALDGTGDYLDIEPTTSDFFNFGTDDFTIEFWMYLTNITGEKIIFESRAGHTDAGLLIMLNTGVIKTLTSNAVRTTGGTTIAADTWYHVAVVRDSTSLRTYLNGTEESGSVSYTSAITCPFSKFRLGARFDGANPPAGYFSDVRITKGLARYTANFTAPTEALQG